MQRTLYILKSTKEIPSIYNKTQGSEKMGHHPTPANMLQSTQEPTMKCSKCPNTTNTTLLTTPYGKLCPTCYSLIYIPVSQPKTLVKVA